MAMSEIILKMRRSMRGASNQNGVMNPNQVMRKGMSLSKGGVLFTVLQVTSGLKPQTAKIQRFDRSHRQTSCLGSII